MFEDTKGVIVNQRRTDNTMVKVKRTKEQTIHRKLKIEQHETRNELRCSGGVNI